MKIPKPHLLPYDDDYVLISKVRLLSGNHAGSSMALLISGLCNISQRAILTKFTREAVNQIESWSDSKINSHIQTILESYNQQPNQNEN